MNDVERFNLRRPLCACGKVSFDKKSAATKSNLLHRSGNGKRFRIYQCPMSNTWHLTKQLRRNEEFKPHAAELRRKKKRRMKQPLTAGKNSHGKNRLRAR
jgi:hypothetical protein